MRKGERRTKGEPSNLTPFSLPFRRFTSSSGFGRVVASFLPFCFRREGSPSLHSLYNIAPDFCVSSSPTLLKQLDETILDFRAALADAFSIGCHADGRNRQLSGVSVESAARVAQVSQGRVCRGL